MAVKGLKAQEQREQKLGLGSSRLVALSTQLMAKLDNYHCVQGLRAQEQCEVAPGLPFRIHFSLKQTAGHDRVDWWHCPPIQWQHSIIITVYSPRFRAQELCERQGGGPAWALIPCPILPPSVKTTTTTKTKQKQTLDVKHDEKRRVGVRARDRCEQAGGAGLSFSHSLSHSSPVLYNKP